MESNFIVLMSVNVIETLQLVVTKRFVCLGRMAESVTSSK